MAGIEKSVAPKALEQRLAVARARGEHNVGGQIAIFRAEAVGEPRAEGGAVTQQGAAVHKIDGRIVDIRIRVQGTNDGEFVRHFGKMWQQLGDNRA